jgi:hypothetical protein
MSGLFKDENISQNPFTRRDRFTGRAGGGSGILSLPCRGFPTRFTNRDAETGSEFRRQKGERVSGAFVLLAVPGSLFKNVLRRR